MKTYKIALKTGFGKWEYSRGVGGEGDFLTLIYFFTYFLYNPPPPPTILLYIHLAPLSTIKPAGSPPCPPVHEGGALKYQFRASATCRTRHACHFVVGGQKMTILDYVMQFKPILDHLRPFCMGTLSRMMDKFKILASKTLYQFVHMCSQKLIKCTCP